MHFPYSMTLWDVIHTHDTLQLVNQGVLLLRGWKGISHAPAYAEATDYTKEGEARR